MARIGISTGSIPNDGTGDTLRNAGGKINSNFQEIYDYFGDGTNLSFSGGVWETTGSGINTTSNVGVGTTNPRFNLEVGYVGASGTTLWVNGDTRITGILTVGSSSITLNGSTNTINVGSGITINGDSGRIDASDFYASGLQVGVITATTVVYEGGVTLTQDWIKTAAGIHTLSNVGLGTTNPTSALTVKGNTSLETLSVSGISTLNGLLISNDGGNNGSVLIEDTGAYSQISFRASNGTTQAQIQGVESSLYIGSGSAGYISLSSPTANLFYPNGNVVLNNGNQGTTLIRNQVHVQSGITSFYDNVSVGGTISVDGGVTLATNNETIVGTSGTAGEIKQIAGAPFYYDGSAWREFVLSSGTPVTQPADTEWDNVIFRATFDDDFTDAKFGATPLVGSGASIVGAAVTIGTGAFRNTGVGVSYAYRDDYDFTGSWTMEFWIYFDSAPFYIGYVSLVSGKNDTDQSGEWSFALQAASAGYQYFRWMNENGSTQTLAIYGASEFENQFVNKWAHIALVKEGDSGDLHFYVNGIESGTTTSSTVIDNDILNISGTGLHIGGADQTHAAFVINSQTINDVQYVDAIFDDMRISAGVGTAGQRYTSIGISTYATFTPPTTALPTSGTLSSVVNPPGDKYGEITLGGSPSWRGTSGVTVSQQSSGNYRVSFASTYTNSNDYFVLSHPMDQGFASYVGIARSTTHVDLSINRQSDDAAVDTGALAVQIKNHI